MLIELIYYLVLLLDLLAIMKLLIASVKSFIPALIGLFKTIHSVSVWNLHLREIEVHWLNGNPVIFFYMYTYTDRQ